MDDLHIIIRKSRTYRFKKYKNLQLLRQNGLCFYCNCKLYDNNTTIDHIVPLSKSGTNNKNNFVVCCRKCNGKKASFDVEDFMNMIHGNFRKVKSTEALRVMAAWRIKAATKAATKNIRNSVKGIANAN